MAFPLFNYTYYSIVFNTITYIIVPIAVVGSPHSISTSSTILCYPKSSSEYVNPVYVTVYVSLPFANAFRCN